MRNTLLWTGAAVALLWAHPAAAQSSPEAQQVPSVAPEAPTAAAN